MTFVYILYIVTTQIRILSIFVYVFKYSDYLAQNIIYIYVYRLQTLIAELSNLNTKMHQATGQMALLLKVNYQGFQVSAYTLINILFNTLIFAFTSDLALKFLLLTCLKRHLCFLKIIPNFFLHWDFSIRLDSADNSSIGNRQPRTK